MSLKSGETYRGVIKKSERTALTIHHPSTLRCRVGHVQVVEVLQENLDKARTFLVGISSENPISK